MTWVTIDVVLRKVEVAIDGIVIDAVAVAAAMVVAATVVIAAATVVAAAAVTAAMTVAATLAIAAGVIVAVVLVSMVVASYQAALVVDNAYDTVFSSTNNACLQYCTR